MPTYTATGSVWINEGGRVVCCDHGGSYLSAAIANGKGPHILTPLDDWLYHSPATAAKYGFTCEDCDRKATQPRPEPTPPTEQAAPEGDRS